MGFLMYIFVVFSVLFPAVLSDRDKVEFAENLLQCTNIKHINDCLHETLEDLRSFMRVGIPELELMPSEPFKINRLHFKTKSIGAFGVSGVQVESTFSNVSINISSTYIFKQFEEVIFLYLLDLFVTDIKNKFP